MHSCKSMTPQARFTEILIQLEAEANPVQAAGMAKFGIAASNAFGIRLPVLRKIAKDTGRDQPLADLLWHDPHHECKLLASMLADPETLELHKADAWVRDLYSWDLCDQLCMNLLVKTPYAWDLPHLWAPNGAEFVRRAGLVMIAVMAVHHKKSADEDFLQFVPLLESCAGDPRNFVKKAVNWAVRQLGKRSASLHPYMISLCEVLLEKDSASASWIARDALRELNSEAIQRRLKLV